MNQAAYNDEQIQAAILGSQTQRQALFAWLYRDAGWREWVLRHVQAENGDLATGEDVFQETVILFDRNLREGRFQSKSGLKTYFLGIAKQFWFNRRRSLKSHAPVETLANLAQPGRVDTDFLERERAEAVRSVVAQLGEHCRKVLSLYKLSLTNEEIAQELGLSSPDLAKKYSYRCREKFREYVLKRPELIDLLNIKLENG